MKKALLVALATVSLFGSTKGTNSKDTFWEIGKRYECKFDNRPNSGEAMLLSTDILQFSGRMYFHIQSEYDIYSANIDNYVAYLGLMKDGSIKVFTSDGVLNEYINCKKK